MNRITLAHGDGGELAHQLIQEVFVEAFGSNKEAMFDAAVFSAQGKLAVSTDSFVVKPMFFNGGNIGKIAVCGTVNDIAVSGATPLYLTCGFIIEEGLLVSDLKKIVQSMAEEAKKAGVQIVAGDTKVVEKGSCDGVYINTTGIGIVTYELTPDAIEEGDSVLISGTIGDHGISILVDRGELGLTANIASDCASLHGLIEEAQKTGAIKMMRDPTRGGLATTLVELCEDFHVTMEIEEQAIPLKDEVHGACDILGFDPLYLANEGKAIFIVKKEQEQQVLEVLQRHPLGVDAAVIGHVVGKDGKLLLRTPIGSTRRMHRLSGMLLPRIC
ncbi:hydrogenase expression/formation protein HypE [Massilibacterium senegalense]|uniref:hydrogenase expression/formation protein HypE n=1 Tax=Massilibacterium senegalense TaxID=1632858 RepID=UPI000784346B|nr:hydrogenase expression/formation protein HypE [Massilibacterium senegalense]